MKTTKDSGIYQIRNTLNGHLYVGSAKDIYQRWCTHRGDLRRNVHHSSYLQNAWNKYGKDSFVFEVLELCPKEQLLWVEQDFLDDLCPEYNINPVAGNRLGVMFTDEIRKKISLALTGIKRSEETKRKISLSKKGVSPAYNKGKPMSEETRYRLSLAKKGKPWTNARRLAHLNKGNGV